MHSGEGPGPKTADGCSVELYLRLPYCGEVELIEPYIPGREVLELGCGVGRLTRQLVARGYRVTAVDNSADMLAHVPAEADTVCLDIEELELATRFDAVVLASMLINAPIGAQRMRLLEVCFRQLRPGGRLIFERFDPRWLACATTGPLGPIGGVELHVERLVRHRGHFAVSLRYRAGSDEWRQHFVAAPLDDEQVRTCLVQANFAAPSWINRRWGYAER